MPATTSQQRLLAMRIKGQRLSGWDLSSHRYGCPHCPALGSEGGHVFHIFWTCPSAQLIWELLRSKWASIGSWRHKTSTVNEAFKFAVFSMTLDITPPIASQLVPHGAENIDWATTLHDEFATLWSLQVVTAFQLIWRWRHQHPPDTTRWTTDQARAAADASFTACLLQTQAMAPRSAMAAVLRRMWTASASEYAPPPNIPSTRPNFLLFFDGGSRGNPGPGGAGSVILRVDEDGSSPTLIWSAATSLVSPTTTNNLAEYTGLHIGLTAAEQHRWRPHTVIGTANLSFVRCPSIAHPKRSVFDSSTPYLGSPPTVFKWVADGFHVPMVENHVRDLSGQNRHTTPPLPVQLGRSASALNICFQREKE